MVEGGGIGGFGGGERERLVPWLAAQWPLTLTLTLP